MIPVIEIYINNMKRYVVTKESQDGTFQIGDHIKYEEDGSISCLEAQGWIEADDVPRAIIGMEAVPDREWIEKRKKKLLYELNLLD